MQKNFNLILKYNLGVYLQIICFFIANYFANTILAYFFGIVVAFYYYNLFYVIVNKKRDFLYFFIFQILSLGLVCFAQEFYDVYFVIYLILVIPYIYFPYKIYKELLKSEIRNDKFLFLAIFMPIFLYRIKGFLLENYSE